MPKSTTTTTKTTTKDTTKAAAKETKTKTKAAAKETKSKSKVNKAVPKTTQKAKKGTKRERASTENIEFPEPPKNKRNAYTFFFREKREGVSAANADSEFGEITKKVAEMWNALQDSEKKKYEKEAAKDAKRYDTERVEWDEKVRQLGGEPDDVIRSIRDAKKQRKNRVKPPKGARNPYVLFSMDKRKELASENLAFEEMTKRLGQEWEKVSAKEKKKYEKAAEEDKARYESEMDKFREEHPDQEEAKKARRKRKKEGEPKGPRNAYIFFGQDERKKITAENDKLAPKEVVTELGKRWSALDDKEKSKYNELAENDKKRYEKEMKKWTASQSA